MSFSEEIKSEILKKYTNTSNLADCCIKAERFGEYLTEVKNKSELESKFKDYLNISKINECCMRSILVGAFLSSGYITSPKLDYHFEINIKNKACTEYIYNLLSLLEFTPKILKRKENNCYAIYIKESDQIATFLGLISANVSLLKFEQIRVEKEVKNNINRAINCETANLTKTINNSFKIKNAIEILKKNGKYNNLNEKLKYAIFLKEKYPDKSLSYIASTTINTENKITKSGLKHRLDKIIELANSIDKEGSKNT